MTADAQIQSVLTEHTPDRQNLIPILQDIQGRVGYLSTEAVTRVAQWLHLSPNDIFGVATFYSQFRFHPPGKHCIKVCQGTACHVRGSSLIMTSLSRRLGIAPGQTTPDREFSLEEVMCLGSCALAPAVVVDETVSGRMTTKKLEELLEPRESI